MENAEDKKTENAKVKPESAKETKRTKRGCMVWLVNLLAMAAVIVLLLLLLIWGLNIYTHHGEGIEVPNVVGKNYTGAIMQADQQGLRLVANDSTYIKEMPAGSIVLQQPVAGERVKEGHVIYVTINSYTLPRVEIPDLIDNSSYREAQAKLQALDFVVLPPKLVEGEKDWVYGIQCGGRSLAKGDLVAKESHLTLLIGNGLVGEESDMNDYIEDYENGRIMEGPDDMEEVLELPIEETANGEF